MNVVQQHCLVFLSNQRGDVLLEYVILTLGIVVPLVMGAGALFNPAGDYTGNFGGTVNAFGDTNTFGVMGTAFHDWYTNTVNLVSLPIP